MKTFLNALIFISCCATYHEANGAIKHIIFDLGGVILADGPQYSAQNSQRVGLSQAFKSDAWQQWMKGMLTKNQLIDQLSLSFKREDIEWVLAQTLNPARPLVAECVAIINELKRADYKVYVLSNFARETYQTFIVDNEFFKNFDGMMFSYQVGYTKPNAIFYTLFLEKYNLNPAECVFIDDVADNVYAAQQLDIKGIVYKNGALKSVLNALLNTSP